MVIILMYKADCDRDDNTEDYGHARLPAATANFFAQFAGPTATHQLEADPQCGRSIRQEAYQHHRVLQFVINRL